MQCIDIGRNIFNKDSILSIRAPIIGAISALALIACSSPQKPSVRELPRHILSENYVAGKRMVTFGTKGSEILTELAQYCHKDNLIEEGFRTRFKGTDKRGIDHYGHKSIKRVHDNHPACRDRAVLPDDSLPDLYLFEKTKPLTPSSSELAVS